MTVRLKARAMVEQSACRPILPRLPSAHLSLGPWAIPIRRCFDGGTHLAGFLKRISGTRSEPIPFCVRHTRSNGRCGVSTFAVLPVAAIVGVWRQLFFPARVASFKDVTEPLIVVYERRQDVTEVIR